MSIFSRKLFAEPEQPKDSVVYLIDTENVKTVWTLLLENMTERDSIYVFYTMNSGSVSYEAINGIMSSGKHIVLKECFTGKNGLDFQLVSYLGYLIKENESADYCIISDDSGYDAAVKFWNKFGVKVSRKTAAQVSGKPVKPVRGRSLNPLKSMHGTAAKPAAPKKTPAKPAAKQESAPKTETPAKSEEAKPAAPKKAPARPAAKQESTPKAEAPAKSGDRKPESQAPEKPESKPESKPETKAKQSAPAKTETDAKQESAAPAEGPAPAPAKKQRKYRVSAAALSELLSEEDPDHRGAIFELLEKAGGPNNLADIHDGIEKIYRAEKATEIYRLIKAHIKELYL